MRTHARIIFIRSGSMALLFGVCVARAAQPIDTWAERYVGASVSDVAYGKGLFVAVGDAFYNSPDGICWKQQPLEPASVNGLSGVTYGNGRFVAVESGSWRRESRVFTSDTGVSWQLSALMPASDLPVIQRVYFAGGMYLAVGQEPNPPNAPGFHWLVMTSADGVAWTRHSGPTNSGESYYLNAASYGNGTYVVGGWARNPAAQGLVLVSSDLNTWTPVSEFPFAVVNGITFGKGKFVAVGSSIGTSADGSQWTNPPAETSDGLAGVTFGGDSFVASGVSGFLLSSSDGISWTRHDTRVDGLGGITYGDGSFVAVGAYFTNLPRGVAVQSGGSQQICLQAHGFGPVWAPGFRLLLTAEQGRSYRLQYSPVLPATSWTDVDSIVLPLVYPDPVQLVDASAPATGQRFYQVVSP